jgi:hypothetical protein
MLKFFTTQAHAYYLFILLSHVIYFLKEHLKRIVSNKNHQKIIMQTKMKYDIPKRVFLVKKFYELKEISLV